MGVNTDSSFPCWMPICQGFTRVRRKVGFLEPLDVVVAAGPIFWDAAVPQEQKALVVRDGRIEDGEQIWHRSLMILSR